MLKSNTPYRTETLIKNLLDPPLFMQSEQGLHCRFTKSLDTVKYIYEYWSILWVQSIHRRNSSRNKNIIYSDTPLN